MNETKATYTPGPWFDCEPNVGISERERQGGSYVGIGNGRKAIARAVISTLILVDEAIVNARLIAAAPELLEAAKQVIWKLSHNHDVDGYNGPGRITREDATVKMLYAAIAKAEGR